MSVSITASHSSVLDIRRGEVTLSRPSSDDIELLFTGDLCLGKRVEQLCAMGAYEKIFNDALPVLRQKDVQIVNLESPLTRRRHPIAKDGPHLSSDPQCIEALRFGGVDVVALANNHIMDHGADGLRDTLGVCRTAGLRTVGAGEDLRSAQEPLFVEVKGRHLAFVNFAEHEFSIAGKQSGGANPLDIASNYTQIRKAQAKADVVCVIVHGGHEHYPLPSPRMVDTYRFLADLNVAAVVGHHSHFASGFEIHNKVPIFYSLGNFIFDSESQQSPSWYTGYFVRLTITEKCVSKITLYPYVQFRDTVGLHLLKDEEKEQYLRSIQEYSATIGDSEKLEKSWREFCRSNSYRYLRFFLRLNRFQRALFKTGLLERAVVQKEELVSLLNLLQCEAHRDATINILRTKISGRS